MMADEAGKYAREYIDRIVETQKRVGGREKVRKDAYESAVDRAGKAFKELIAVSESARREQQPAEERRSSRR